MNKLLVIAALLVVVALLSSTYGMSINTAQCVFYCSYNKSCLKGCLKGLDVARAQDLVKVMSENGWCSGICKTPAFYEQCVCMGMD